MQGTHNIVVQFRVVMAHHMHLLWKLDNTVALPELTCQNTNSAIPWKQGETHTEVHELLSTHHTIATITYTPFL